MAKILVTGGLGYIGSHTVVELQNEGFEVIIIDDLSNTSIEVLDKITSITGIKPIFEQIDLKVIENTFKTGKNPHLLKTFWREWPTNCRLFHCKQSHTTICPICQEMPENTTHVLSCPITLSVRKLSLLRYHDELKRAVPCHIQTVFITNIIAVLKQADPTPSHFKSTTIDLLTFRAYEDQIRIGWVQFLLGKISKLWESGD